LPASAQSRNERLGAFGRFGRISVPSDAIDGQLQSHWPQPFWLVGNVKKAQFCSLPMGIERKKVSQAFAIQEVKSCKRRF